MTQNQPLPLNERQRLLKLLDYDLYNTEPDPILDRYVALAAEIAGTPLAFYNLVGETQQLSKAKFGSTDDFGIIAKSIPESIGSIKADFPAIFKISSLFLKLMPGQTSSMDFTSNPPQTRSFKFP